jgi:hypothetical protein
MWRLLLALSLPALAIAGADLGRRLLTWVWPGIQRVGVGYFSADTALFVAGMALFAFLVGAWLQRRIGSFAGAVCAVIIPTVWLGLVLRVELARAPEMTWLRPATVVMVAIAVAPLLGVGAGLGVSLLWPRRTNATSVQ